QEELNVIGLDTRLEQVLSQALGSGGALEPGLAETLMSQARAAVERQESQGHPPVLVVQHGLRPVRARFLLRRLRHLAVRSQAEVPDDRTLRVTSLLGGA